MDEMSSILAIILDSQEACSTRHNIKSINELSARMADSHSDNSEDVHAIDLAEISSRFVSGSHKHFLITVSWQNYTTYMFYHRCDCNICMGN